MLLLNLSRRFLASLSAVLFLLLALPSAAAPPTLPAATSAFLAKFVNSDGNVNYAAIKRNPLELQGLLKRVAAFDAAAASDDERKAFYLNAYNLLVIGEVVARYPLESVEKVPGFFDKNLVSVAGEKMTINDLENKKLREPFKDARVHFALVCAAKGCPRLSRAAYTANSLETQLTVQAQKVLQDPTFIRVDDKAGKVFISQLFKWYEADFKASGKTGVAYLNQFREGKKIPATYKVDYYPYDWSLNKQK